MSGGDGLVRPARPGDAGAVAELAAELAQSFPFSPDKFRLSYPALLAAGDARLLLAARGLQVTGYLLGFTHLTFFANGPVGWVEEVIVRPQDRGQGTGAALMSAFEQWAGARGCALVALATRRAAPFYRAKRRAGGPDAASAARAAGSRRRVVSGRRPRARARRSGS